MRNALVCNLAAFSQAGTGRRVVSPLDFIAIPRRRHKQTDDLGAEFYPSWTVFDHKQAEIVMSKVGPNDSVIEIPDTISMGARNRANIAI
jgi:hypothetical protein